MLDEIRKSSGGEKSLKINVVGIDSAARPALTEKQAELYKLSASEFDRANNVQAVKLASKKSLGRKGEGTSVSLDWNPRQALAIDAAGRPTEIVDEATAFASLAHELVHGYRIIKGTFTGGTSDRYEPSSAAADEEDRAVGTGKYADQSLSENGIREEHGLPIRKFYRALPQPEEASEPMVFR